MICNADADDLTNSKVGACYKESLPPLLPPPNICTDVVSSSEEFFTIMKSIGAKAANLPGSVRKLGTQNNTAAWRMNTLSNDETYPLYFP